PDGDGDVPGPFEAEQEIRGRLAEEPLPVVLAGELVEGEVAADGGKRRGVFGQARLLEFLLRVLAPRLVAFLAVDRPEPALVFPGAGAEIDALVGQRAQLRRQPGPR